MSYFRLLLFSIVGAIFSSFLPHAHAQINSPSSYFSSFDTFQDGEDPFLELEEPKKNNGPPKTEITSETEATFNNKTNRGEFLGRVVVKNPQFNLLCDHLIITLKKDRRGLQHAEGIGNVIITQENTDSEGKVTRSIGRAGRANYNPETGDIVLTEWPQLQQGINNHIAADKNTRMTLNKEGRNTTLGQSKTVIVDTQKTTSF